MFLLLAAVASLPSAHAATVGGYFRLQARPDLVGGDGRLGSSALYGRLLNEGPWGLLELRQPLITGAPGSPAGSLTVRVEGGGVAGGDATNGSLAGFRISQLHLDADEVAGLTWRVGTLETTFGDLWLFDARPTQLMVDVLGGAATWSRAGTTATFGLGDAGWSLRGARYHAVPSIGAAITRGAGPWTFGLSGQAWYEPADGDPDALVDTPGLDLAAWTSDPAAWATANPSAALTPPRPVAGRGWKLAAHLGYTGDGLVRDARLQATWHRQLPDSPLPVTVADTEVHVGAAGLTDRREIVVVGAQTDLVPVPGRLEVAWGGWMEVRRDPDDLDARRRRLAAERDAAPDAEPDTGPGAEPDTAPDTDGDPRAAASLSNRAAFATVARAHLGVARYVALLGEGSLAHEAARGAPAKDTWQLKAGVVLSPAGVGLGARPALRLLGGVQRSSQVDAWPGTPTGSHWHGLASIEAEAWF